MAAPIDAAAVKQGGDSNGDGDARDANGDGSSADSGTATKEAQERGRGSGVWRRSENHGPLPLRRSHPMEQSLSWSVDCPSTPTGIESEIGAEER